MKRLSPAEISMYISMTLLPINQYSVINIFRILRKNNINKYKYNGYDIRINILYKKSLDRYIDNIKSLIIELSNFIYNICIYVSFRINKINYNKDKYKASRIKSIYISRRKIIREIVSINNRFYLLEYIKNRNVLIIKRLNIKNAEHVDLRIIPQSLFVFCGEPAYVTSYIHDSVKDVEKIIGCGG